MSEYYVKRIIVCEYPSAYDREVKRIIRRLRRLLKEEGEVHTSRWE